MWCSCSSPAHYSTPVETLHGQVSVIASTRVGSKGKRRRPRRMSCGPRANKSQRVRTSKTRTREIQLSQKVHFDGFHGAVFNLADFGGLYLQHSYYSRDGVVVHRDRRGLGSLSRTYRVHKHTRRVHTALPLPLLLLPYLFVGRFHTAAPGDGYTRRTDDTFELMLRTTRPRTVQQIGRAHV